MAAKTFFDHLKSKIAKQPDRRFDQVFWSKFEREFGASPFAPKPSALDRVLAMIRPVRYFVTAGGAAALALMLYVRAPWRPSSMQPQDFAGAHLAQMQGVLDNLELLETLDDMDISDQEWGELLDEEKA
jgi:hypothetical protein